MVNTSSIQDDGTDTTLAKWPSKYGLASADGKIRLQAQGGNQYAGVATDVASAPLNLDYFEGQVYVEGAGTAPKASFTLGTATDGTRLGFAWDAGAWTPLNQVAYGDVTPQGTPVAAAAGTTLRLAIIRHSTATPATRYAAGTYVVGDVYMFTSPADLNTWTQRYHCAAPSFVTACRQQVLTEVGSSASAQNHVSIDDVNLLTGAPAATVPGAVATLTAARSATDPTIATVTWTPPANTGGSAITGYVVSDGTQSQTVTPTTRTFTFSGRATTGYTFTVVAVNAVGNGPSSTQTIDPYVPPSTGDDGTRPPSTALPLLNTVGDDFNDIGLDPALWVVITSGITQAGGVVNVDMSGGADQFLLTKPLSGMDSVGGVDQIAEFQLLGSLDAGQSVGLMVRASADSRIGTQDVSKRLFIGIKDGVLTVLDEQNGVGDSAPGVTPYSPTKHGYVRFRFSQANQRVYAESTPPPAAGQVLNSATAVWTQISSTKVIPMPSWAGALQAGLACLQASNVVPATTVPSVPTAVTRVIQTDQTSVRVSWAAPASDGGSAITKYTITRDGTDAGGTVGWTNTATQPGYVDFLNLVPGQSYTFVVYATNANGDGAKSSGSVTIPAASGGGGSGKFDDFTTAAPVGPTPPTGKTWSKRFVDDFTGSAFSTRWRQHRPDGTGEGEQGWGNETYWAANSYVGTSPDGKTCAILRMDTNLHAGVITTGTANAQQIAFKPGDYLEAYIRTPPASDGSMWPAWWGIGVANPASNGGNGSGVGWPPEIDYFEFGYVTKGSGAMGDTHGRPVLSTHFNTAGNRVDGGAGEYGTGDLRGQWHNFGIYWRASDNTLLAYIDGVFTGKSCSVPSFTDGRGNQQTLPQVLIFSHQIQAGGLTAPSFYYMDWVRLWSAV